MKKIFGIHLLAVTTALLLPIEYVKASSIDNNKQLDITVNNKTDGNKKIKNQNSANEKQNTKTNSLEVVKRESNDVTINNEQIKSSDTIKEEEQKDIKKAEEKEDFTIEQEIIGDTTNIKVIDPDVQNTKSETREKILNDFKKKLENSNEEVRKTRTESIDSDFAIIIEKRNQDKIKKEEFKNAKNIDQDILDVATKQIGEKKQETAKNIYVKQIEKEIKQKEQTKEINSNSKSITKKPSSTKTKNKDKFNITDTNVTEEVIYDEKFQKFVRDYKVDLDNKSNETQTVKLLIPQEKKMVNFETDDIPDELISSVRSDENRHIPHILTASDFQNTATRAINENDLDTIRGIVELTKNPNYILKNGQTMLNYASSLGNIEITKYLIFNGANLNTINLSGNTALHNAILKNNMDIVKLLVQNNANLEIFNVDGYTPLMLSIVEGRNDITLYLLKFDQNLMLKNSRNETTLDIAIKHHRLVIKELILEIIARENDNL